MTSGNHGAISSAVRGHRTLSPFFYSQRCKVHCACSFSLTVARGHHTLSSFLYSRHEVAPLPMVSDDYNFGNHCHLLSPTLFLYNLCYGVLKFKTRKNVDWFCVGNRVLMSLNYVDFDGGANGWCTMTKVSTRFPFVSHLLYVYFDIFFNYQNIGITFCLPNHSCRCNNIFQM